MSNKISVILPVYNGSSYIAECILSLLNQSYSNFEIIIIDDCSTDNTPDIIASFYDERIRYYRNHKNHGIVFSLNKALSLVTGQYIARMDADDICCTERFERQVEFLETHPEIGIVSTWFELFGSRSGTIRYSTNPEEIKCKLLFSLQLLHPGWMIRRQVLETHNLLYREEYRYAEDWDFLVRASHITQLANLNQVLMRYRVNPQQVSNTHAEIQRNIADKVAKNQLEHVGLILNTSEFRIFRRLFGKHDLLVSQYEMKSLLLILQRLIDANEVSHTYHSKVLFKVIQNELFWLSYFNLLHKQKSGLLILTSPFLKGLNLSLLNWSKFIIRIFQTILAFN